MRSDLIKSGVDRTPHKALLKALGVTDMRCTSRLLPLYVRQATMFQIMCASAQNIKTGE